MKRTWLTILVIVFCGNAWSQKDHLSLNVSDIQLGELFHSIEEDTNYKFFYNNDEVDVTSRVTLKVENKTVKEILALIFEKLPYKFREEENKLILIEVKPTKHDSNGTSQPLPLQVFGKVTDEDGNILPGVSVMVKGTKLGTITNHRGLFSLKVPPGKNSIVFSFVGMRPQEIMLNERTTLNIVLKEQAIGLNEIVVIGYGSIKKSDLTGAVAVVSSDDLNQSANGDFATAFQGKAPGVYVTQSGIPGGGGQIRVRGIGSINQAPNPIYVIDGIVTGSASLNTISPSDIESIQVLKDASAAAIYGADGANGVIIINTKRGETGQPKVSYTGFASLHLVPHMFEVMNANDYAAFYHTILSENNISVPVAYTNHFREWYYGNGWQSGTNWQDEITRNAFGQNHNLRISGGGEKSNYAISLNYFSENGILLSSSYDRYNIRINSDFLASKYFRVGETLSLTRNVSQNPSKWEGNPWQVSLITSPLMRVYNPNNKGGFEGPQISYEYIIPDGTTDYISNTGYNDKVNPRAPLEIGNYRSFNNNMLASLYLEIKPYKWLTIKTMPSVEGNFNRLKNWFPAFDLGVRSNGQAQLDENYLEMISVSLENQITFSNQFNKHNVSATAVHHVRRTETNNLEAKAQGFPYEQLNVISQSYEEGRQVNGEFFPFASESYLARVIYDFNNRYLLTASIRSDGNSRFGPENRWGTFPSVSVGWKINEDFFTGSDKLNLLKMRLGWGKTGNSNIGYFQYMSTLDDFSQFSPVFGENQKLVPALNVVHNFGNPYLKWEAAEMWNFGIDANLFRNKARFTLEYYRKDQNDLLVKMPLTSAYGRVSGRGDPWVNLGEIQNNGIEFSGYYTKPEGRLNYNLSGNFSYVKNLVNYVPGEIISGNNITTPGYAIGSFYGHVAERILTAADFDAEHRYIHAMPATGKPAPGDLKFTDINNDGVVNELDRTIIGKAIPDFVYSLNFEAFYENFDFSVFFFGMQNFEIYNHLRADIEGFSSQDMGHNKTVEYALNYYREDRPSIRYVRVDLNNINQNNRPSTWFLEDGSFFRLKNIQLGYTIPELFTAHLGITRTRFYVSATNLITFTAYKGRDPEAPMVSEPLTPGNDEGTYPVPRQLTFGVQVDF